MHADYLCVPVCIRNTFCSMDTYGIGGNFFKLPKTLVLMTHINLLPSAFYRDSFAKWLRNSQL